MSKIQYDQKIMEKESLRKMSEIEGGYYMEHAVFLAGLSLVLRITWCLCVVRHLMLILISQFTIIYLFILFSVIKVFFI